MKARWIIITIHSANVIYQPKLSNYISKEYHGKFKIKDKSTKVSQILIDLFSHSQRVYFQNQYYIKNANYPEFENWKNYMTKHWHAKLHCAKIYSIVLCNPAQHSWGYLITIPVEPHLINHVVVNETKQVAQQMMDSNSQKQVRMHRIDNLFLRYNQLIITIKKL